ncbi:hypothetical protein [Enterococcus phage vB_EfaS-SRH2]|nr:hypothetical protein [Enterococcus phage vB_EfaS-SRH2]
MINWFHKIKGGNNMALFGLLFVTVGIWGTYNVIKYIED